MACITDASPVGEARASIALPDLIDWRVLNHAMCQLAALLSLASASREVTQVLLPEKVIAEPSGKNEGLEKHPCHERMKS